MKNAFLRKKPRGYMLVEALIASALLGIAIVSIMQQLASGDRVLTASARKAIANAALWDGINRYRAMDYNNPAFSPGAKETNANVKGVPPGMILRNITVTATGTTNVNCRECKKVDVEVRYRTAAGNYGSMFASTLVGVP